MTIDEAHGGESLPATPGWDCGDLVQAAQDQIEGDHIELAVDMLTRFKDDISSDQIRSRDDIKQKQAKLEFGWVQAGILSIIDAKDPKAAKDYVYKRLLESESDFEKLGLHIWVAQAMARRGQHDKAVEHAETAAQIAYASDLPYIPGQALSLKANSFHDQGRFTEAETALALAVNDLERSHTSDVLVPERIRANPRYTVLRQLRTHLEARLFLGHREEVRQFNDRDLGGKQDVSLDGLSRYIIGLAELEEWIEADRPLNMTNQVLEQLEAAGRLFRQADEPVYAGYVALALSQIYYSSGVTIYRIGARESAILATRRNQSLRSSALDQEINHLLALIDIGV